MQLTEAIKRVALPVALAILCNVSTAAAISFDDLVGVYVGKRTDTSETGTLRFNETTIIESDGLITNYVFADWLPGGVWMSQGYIDLNEDGTFLTGETGVGRIELNGRSLNVVVHFDAQAGFPSFPETTVHSRLHRTNDVP